MILTAVAAGVRLGDAVFTCVSEALTLVALGGFFCRSEGLTSESFFVHDDSSV